MWRAALAVGGWHAVCAVATFAPKFGLIRGITGGGAPLVPQLAFALVAAAVWAAAASPVRVACGVAPVRWPVALRRGAVAAAAGTAGVGAFAVCLGAAPGDARAWSLALYVATAGFVPAGAAMDPHDVPTMWRGRGSLSPAGRRVLLAVRWPCAGALAGAWLGCFPLPLDWEVPLQQWPAPCVLGAYIGHAVGSLASSAILCLFVLSGGHAPARARSASGEAI